MVTVCIHVQSAEKCLVSGQFQREDNSLSLSKLFENVKSSRVSIIVPSSKLSMAQLEEVFIRKSKEILTNIDPSIQLCDVATCQFWTVYLVQCCCSCHYSCICWCYYIGTTKYFCLYDAEQCQDGSSRMCSLAGFIT